jgi:hypothetical protein
VEKNPKTKVQCPGFTERYKAQGARNKKENPKTKAQNPGFTNSSRAQSTRCKAQEYKIQVTAFSEKFPNYKLFIPVPLIR